MDIYGLELNILVTLKLISPISLYIFNVPAKTLKYHIKFILHGAALGFIPQTTTRYSLISRNQNLTSLFPYQQADRLLLILFHTKDLFPRLPAPSQFLFSCILSDNLPLPEFQIFLTNLMGIVSLILIVMSLNNKKTKHLFQKHISHSSFSFWKWPFIYFVHLNFCLLISRSKKKKYIISINLL